MYDAPGSDNGHEWLEVSNVGSSSVNLLGYKFFEGGVNHGVVAVSGGTMLAAGASAVIADNAATFSEDYPAYAGLLFKSSFSLLNTGETLALKDASSTIVDSIAYASSMGGAGDGNSLHRVGDSFVAGAPNPGSMAPTAALIKAQPAPPTNAAQAKTAGKSKNASSYASTTPASVASAVKNTPDFPVSDNDSTLVTALLGLGALIIVGVGGVMYVRMSGIPAPETELTADEFDIQ